MIDDSSTLKGAAARIGMSQRRATKSLQEIEDIVGQQLFTSTNQGLKPTIAGSCAIRHAKVMLSQIRSFQEELRHIADGAWVKLRIGTIMGAIPIVTEAILSVCSRSPNVFVEIFEDTSGDLFHLLDRGDLDLIVGRSSVSTMPELYDIVAFHDESLTVVANPAHRAETSDPCGSLTIPLDRLYGANANASVAGAGISGSWAGSSAYAGENALRLRNYVASPL